MRRRTKDRRGPRQFTSGQWRLRTKAQGAIEIRDLGSLRPDRWKVLQGQINSNVWSNWLWSLLTQNFLTWEVRPQGWNSKELTGAFYKRWNMWFNSILREKPYQRWLGVAWLSSARVVRCVVDTRNGHNPSELLIRLVKLVGFLLVKLSISTRWLSLCSCFSW